MFQPSTNYKLIDPQGIIRAVGSAKLMRQAKRKIEKATGDNYAIAFSVAKDQNVGDRYNHPDPNWKPKQMKESAKPMAKQTNKTAATTATIITMVKDKDCKHVIRYKADDIDALCDNVYLSKRFADPMPQTIRITIEPQ